MIIRDIIDHTVYEISIQDEAMTLTSSSSIVWDYPVLKDSVTNQKYELQSINGVLSITPTTRKLPTTKYILRDEYGMKWRLGIANGNFSYFTEYQGFSYVSYCKISHYLLENIIVSLYNNIEVSLLDLKTILSAYIYAPFRINVKDYNKSTILLRGTR